MHRQVMWKTVQEPGFEHLSLTCDDRGCVADGLVIGVAGEPPEPFRLRYRVEATPAFAVRGVVATVEHPVRRALALRADEWNAWHDAATGEPLEAFRGCSAVDIMTTPFTNTLAIRSFAWTPGATHDLSVAYVSVPDLALTRDEQRYTCLAQHADRSRYRIESLVHGFAYELDVDADGLVLDYADVFARVASS